MTFRHILLTRFNCRFAAKWTDVAIDPAWLGPRFELFERYCLPSVRQQTENGFKWIIFFDRETPEPYAARARELAKGAYNAHFVGDLSGDLIRKTIRDTADGADRVITTRLDNDDAVANDFVERIQAAAQQTPERYYLNFPKGLIVSGDRLYHRIDRSNAFVSYVEPVGDELEGVWAQPHTQIAAHAPVFQIDEDAGWLQVVHGANVSNKVRGTRIPRAGSGLERFSCATDLRIDDAALPRWTENLLVQPFRAARDQAASLKRKLRPQRI